MIRAFINFFIFIPPVNLYVEYFHIYSFFIACSANDTVYMADILQGAM